MKYQVRLLFDKIFTVLASSSVVLMTVILLVVLGPMILRGSRAVFFKSTTGFRKMQLDVYERGNHEKIEKQIAEVQVHRDYIYKKMDAFKKGIDTEDFADKAKNIYRQFGKDLKANGVSGDQLSSRRAFARQIRNDLNDAFESDDKNQIMSILNGMDKYKDDPRIAGTSAEKFFSLADDFREVIVDFDLSKREVYADAFAEFEELVRKLLGPRPDEPLPAMIMDRYGATRYDLSNNLLQEILWKRQWVEQGEGLAMVEQKVERVKDFAGTDLEEIFSYLPDNFDEIMGFRKTIYWQYFIDDSTSGHYFGGVGPEILGTLLLTVLAMIMVFPLGVISAAYLVECTSDNAAVRLIRMCINTLAGVPSIVFRLFGLAFFVLFLLPAFGAPSKPCILAASMTLAVLTLPVMIRASEEAIRSVPNSYKEASLGLGASRFSTFVKVTLPAALPGILTGVILSVGRVAGETAPILFTGACAFGAIPKSLFAQTRTLSYGSYDIAVGDKIGMMVPHNQYGMVVTLVLLIICLNGMAIYLRAKIFRRLKGY